MKKADMIKTIEERMVAIQREIESLASNDSLKGNTKSNMKSRLTRDRNNLSILKAVTGMVDKEEIALKGSQLEAFVSWTEPDKIEKLVVKKGDSVIKLMMANPKLTLERITKAADKAGLGISDKGILE